MARVRIRAVARGGVSWRACSASSAAAVAAARLLTARGSL
jgi:hypothetical protein